VVALAVADPTLARVDGEILPDVAGGVELLWSQASNSARPGNCRIMVEPIMRPSASRMGAAYSRLPLAEPWRRSLSLVDYADQV
jgi:hypothetical protein